MSSTLVSSAIGFNDFPSDYAAFRSGFPDMQRSSAFDKPEITNAAAFTVGLTNRAALTRRHSSSVFGAALSNSLANNMTPTFGDSGGALVGNGLLETVAEERFRSRAYSEGSNLNCELQQQQQQQPQQQQAAQTTSRYKTELCRPYEENGRCKYGDKCQFAHGKHELRHMVRHPKYKTELCRTYHTSGLCMYGPRCHFIHNTDDAPAKPALPRQNSMGGLGVQSQQVSVPVTINNVLQQQKRPTNLQLLSQQQQRNINQINNAFPYPPTSKVNTSPLGTPPGFFAPAEPPLLSPVSPLPGSRTGPAFSFAKAPMSPMDMPKTFGAFDVENRQATPPLTRFDVLQQGPQYMDMSSEDAVFEPPTPPDSDRESESASPQQQGGCLVNPSPQRLPIFRCLSQSE